MAAGKRRGAGPPTSADCAVIGTLFCGFCPTEVCNKQVRTENAALFFATLALLC